MRVSRSLCDLAEVFLFSLLLSGAAVAQQTTTTPPPQPESQPAATAGAPAAEVPQSPDAEPGKKKAEEEIVVTGSRVRRKDLTTPAPVTVINREQLQASGTLSVGDFLQLMPEQGGATNTQVNNGGDGETQISLRQLGASRTLVLVDGKRFVNGGVGAGTAVDLNAIPTMAVERIEILKDGGSAVYGSDAIGGVVNIITRKRVDGVQVNAYSGVSQHNDSKVYDINILSGAQSDRGGFSVGAGYFNQDSMFASGRDWAKNALNYNFATGKEVVGGSGTTPNVRVNALDPTKCSTKLCNDLAAYLAAQGLTGKQNFIFDPKSPSDHPTVDGGWRLRDANTDLYNYQAVNYLVTPSSRVSLFGNGDYKLNDSARAYLQASYVNRQSSYLVAPEPFTTQSAGLAIAANNPYNPFGVDISSAQRRLTDLPGRGGGFEVDTLRVVGGFDGTLPEIAGPLHGWFWDIAFNYGRTAGTFTNSGFLNTQKTGPGLGTGFIDSSGVAHCGTPAAPIANCTPINLFGPPGTISSDMASQLGSYTGINYGYTQLAMASANLSGELFTLLADRPAALAVGFEHRNEFGGYVNQPILAAGWDSDTGSPGPSDTKGHFYVNEGFAELVIPVINHVPGAEEVEVQGAVRAFNYNTFGSDATYKVGARWSPIRDVTLRGTYSTAFRAPNILELYLGQSGGNYESSSDPCAKPANATIAANCTNASGAAGGPNAANNGLIVTQVNSINGGNPALQPEKATIGTLGAVFEPSIVRGLAATLDFYTVSMSQVIGTFGTQLILNDCYGAGVPQDTSFCQYIQRDPSSGGIVHVTDTNANVRQLLTSGIDFSLQYPWRASFGRFLFRFNSTYLLKYDTTLPNKNPDGSNVVIKGAGNYDGRGSVSASGNTNFNPRLKFNVGVNYAIGDFSTALTGRFIGPYTECAPPGASTVNGQGFCYQGSGTKDPNDPTGQTIIPYPSRTVHPDMTFDLLAAYRFVWPGGASTLAVGVRNLLNTDPPRAYDTFLTYADPAYDFVGRYIYARLDHKF